MATRRLRARVPSARVVGKGQLPHHSLRWHKLGRDGSGKCDIAFAGADSKDVVWGVLFDIDLAEKHLLDAAEGLGIGYDEKDVRIVTDDGSCAALTYQARPAKIDQSLKPYAWYKAFVLYGACEHGLPKGYVMALESVKTVEEG